MNNTIHISVKTLSNLFIGGTPTPFEIGGIDQWTAVDEEGFPCIPASSLKGALCAIVGEDRSEEAFRIREWYAAFLQREKVENWELIQKVVTEKEAFNRIDKRYTDAIQLASVTYLFGIREFNNTPKLLFNDLKLKKEYRDLKKCFSIDSKTSINCEGTEPKSNPRPYKTARAGLEFEGEIELYKFDKCFVEGAGEICKEYVISSLLKFNDGIYRLGNSKSRGYGKIHITVIE